MHSMHSMRFPQNDFLQQLERLEQYSEGDEEKGGTERKGKEKKVSFSQPSNTSSLLSLDACCEELGQVRAILRKKSSDYGSI